MSHDRFGEALGGIKRGRIIGWEKEAGSEPDPSARAKLAAFSGFAEAAFSRRLAEAPAAATIRSRLEELAETIYAIGQNQLLALDALKIPEDGRWHLPTRNGGSADVPTQKRGR